MYSKTDTFIDIVIVTKGPIYTEEWPKDWDGLPGSDIENDIS